MQAALELADLTAQVNTALSRLIPQGSLPQARLFKAAKYSLLLPGKRLRPLLAIATANMLLEGPSRAIIQPACALEMIHTFSLIHDDLPAMDDDDLRRGQPTCHKAFDEATAILAGDYLNTYAFEVLASAPDLSAQQRLDLIRHLAQATGGHGMIGGQILDMEAEHKAIDLEELRTLHIKKTGALIACALEFGGIVAESCAATMQVLRDLGLTLGLAFQVVDDILDCTQDTSTLGKPAGSDVRNHKTTYVSLTSLQEAGNYAKNLEAKAYSLIDQLPGDSSLLRQLTSRLVSRTS